MKGRAVNVEIVAGLILFCVFAGAMLLVLTSGAGAYKNVGDELEGQFGERTCVSYIAAKVRHYDSQAAVEIVDFNGMQALCLKEEIQGTPYVTLLYHYDGYVRELFFAQGAELLPEDGETIIAAEALELEEAEAGLLRVECVTEGRSAELYLALRSTGGEGL
ncbi:MAG: DUF4860 domain-containing protein [Bacillota bacterium]|nr:DUF4860 domain-containing protein [Bacillota bacterium]